MSEAELNEAHRAINEALSNGTSHDAAEILMRVATKLWLIQAMKFGPDVADQFTDAMSLDIRDRAKVDGRKFFRKQVN